MAKLKSIAFAVGIMLLIGAALCLYFSLQNLSSIRPASAYEDMGVHTFMPEEVYPVQRENHATGRQKRNHPTTTVYIVRYRAEDGSGYQYKYESGSVESTAQNILKTGDPIERRVLSISGEDGYITIDADENSADLRSSAEAHLLDGYRSVCGLFAGMDCGQWAAAL